MFCGINTVYPFSLIHLKKHHPFPAHSLCKYSTYQCIITTKHCLLSKNAKAACSCHEGSYLRNAVIMGHYPDNIIQGQQWIALDLCVHILALGAGGQQLHQSDVIGQGAALVRSVSLRTHHLQQHWEGCSVIVEYQHIFTAIYQLRKRAQGSEHPALQSFWTQWFYRSFGT